VGDTHFGEVTLCGHNGQESRTVHHFNGISIHEEEVTYVQAVTLDTSISWRGWGNIFTGNRYIINVEVVSVTVYRYKLNLHPVLSGIALEIYGRTSH
jgi:hypothetical protein